VVRGGSLLDAYIIDRINREKAERTGREMPAPLHIEPQRLPDPPPPKIEREPDRGSVVVDFRV
jgi:hypothetical protein